MRISDVGIMELSGLEFHAYHGCFEKERAEGNLFVVDFRAEYHFKTAAKSDRLDDTVDYADVYKVIREEMDKPSNLMENVAWRIVKGIAAKFPEFIRFQIRISKTKIIGKEEYINKQHLLPKMKQKRQFLKLLCGKLNYILIL